MIEGVILAAGFSSRADAFKMSLEFRGKTIIENCLDTMTEFCDNIYVIGGYRIEIIENILKDCNKVHLIFNKNYKDGMFSSVKCGLKVLKGDKFFLTPGDYPIIDRSTYVELIKSNKNIAIPIFHGKKGHPVFMKTELGKSILRSSEFDNLRDFINNKGFSKVEVQDSGILEDVDTYKQYKDLKGRSYFER